MQSCGLCVSNTFIGLTGILVHIGTNVYCCFKTWFVTDIVKLSVKSVISKTEFGFRLPNSV